MREPKPKTQVPRPKTKALIASMIAWSGNAIRSRNRSLTAATLRRCAPRCALHWVLVAPSPLRVVHMVDTPSCRPSCARRTRYCSPAAVPNQPLDGHVVPSVTSCGPTAAVLVRESGFPFYAACSACVRCQYRNRFQQISACTNIRRSQGEGPTAIYATTKCQWVGIKQ